MFLFGQKGFLMFLVGQKGFLMFLFGQKGLLRFLLKSDPTRSKWPNQAVVLVNPEYRFKSMV